MRPVRPCAAIASGTPAVQVILLWRTDMCRPASCSDAAVTEFDTIDVDAALEWASRQVGALSGVRELTGGWTSTMLSLASESGDGFVLRLMTREPWRTHGEALTTREREIQRMLAGTSVPAPRSFALDAAGLACGIPAHLMSLLPGRVDVDRVDPGSLDRLAALLATIHDVVPTVDVRTYQSWAWEAKYLVPPWATDPGIWEEAFALLRSDPPSYEPCFIHRDFQLRNVLWAGGQVSGVVDWVETSIGPAWLDVAHCCTNLAIGHGSEAAAPVRQCLRRSDRARTPAVLRRDGHRRVPAAAGTAGVHRRRTRKNEPGWNGASRWSCSACDSQGLPARLSAEAHSSRQSRALATTASRLLESQRPNRRSDREPIPRPLLSHPRSRPAPESVRPRQAPAALNADALRRCSKTRARPAPSCLARLLNGRSW